MVLLYIMIGSVYAEHLTQVEIYGGKHDAYSQSLQVALESAFSKANGFELSKIHDDSSLRVILDSSVKWKQYGDQTRIYYDIIFADRNNPALGRSKGSCWISQLEECTRHVIADASALQRVH